MSDSYSFLGEDDYLLESVYGNGRPPMPDSGGAALTSSLSFKSDGKNKKKNVKRPSMEGDDFFNLLHGSDPVKVELNRLENEVRDKDRELGEAQAEIKALKLSERAREKAVEELTEELSKVDEKLKANEILLENKNLEIKKINDEKKAALAAQFAAEATLRRVHAAQKDDDMPPIEAILAPLEAELKLHRQEIAKLQEDNRALERLTKSKEAALLDAERTVQIALAKASMVDDLQNRNQELMKQIEICQEENKIVDKIYRQKVAEVEKLSQTVRELEEEILARGAAANAVRDYQRKVHEINEEKKTLNQELARAKVSANRVAPGESMSAQHIKAAEIHPQKKMSGKQQQQPKPPLDVHLFQKKSKGTRSTPPQEYPLPNPNQEAMDHQFYQRASAGTHPFRDHPQEQQLQEFKKQFAAWQASKLKDYSKPLQPDELNRQLSEKQTLLHEKLNEAKMALARDKFIDAKHLATDEKFQQSKEFLDALEVLQSNKELLLKFLQEPNSLFANHTQDIESTSGTQEKQLSKTKSSSTVKSHDTWREKDHNHVKSSKEGNKNERRFKRQKGHKFLAEREDVQQVRALSPDKSMTVCTMHEQTKHYPSMCSDGKDSSSSLPTRIVVLKPGPGRPSPSPSCSPHSQTGLRDSGEKERGTTQDFLQEVRERLKLSLAEKKKDELRITEEGVQDQLCNGPKDPRHIARQIARQVRESVTRDLSKDLSQMRDISTFSGFSGKKNLPSRSIFTSRDVDIGSCTEISMSDTNYSWDYTNRSNPPVISTINKPSDLPKCENNEPKKTVSGRRRTTQWEEEEQKLRHQQLRQISNTLGQMLAFPGNKKHVSQSKSYWKNNRGGAGDDESYVLSCDMHEPGSKSQRSIRQETDAEQEGFLANINVDNYRDASLRSPLSQSVPLATTFERVNGKKQNNASYVKTSNADKIGPDRPGDSLPSEPIKSRIERSSFKGKVSNLKDSLLRGRRSSRKKLNCADTVQPNNYVEIHPDDVLNEVASNSNRLERSYDLNVLCPQEKCIVSVDCHRSNVATELVESPSCSKHIGSPRDDEGSEQCIMDASNSFSASVKDKAKLSGADTDCVVEEVLPKDHVQNIPPCSPTKKPPLDELNYSVNIEKGEHPSPVSVLDLPFQEESTSLTGFEQISSNLQELRLRLRLLKFDGSEKLQHESENLLPGEITILEDHDIKAVECDTEKACTSPSEAELSPAPRFPCPDIENVNIVSMILNHVSCQETKRSDLLYVRDALVASGFSGNADAVFAQWHSPSHPIEPCLYEKLQGNERGKSDSVCEREAYRTKSDKKLLFDCVNEVLLEILGPFFNPRPWAKPTRRKLQQRMPVGTQLLEETWRKISYYLYQQSDMKYTLDNLVEKDLDRDARWLELQDDVEMVGVEVDKMIFDNLIEEVCCDLLHGYEAEASYI